MRYWMVAAAMVCANPASAQVALTSGQGVSIAIAADGEVETGKPHPAALGPHDLEALDQMRIAYQSIPQTEGVLPAVAMNPGDHPMPGIIAGKIEIAFVVIGDKDSVLVILNGYERALVYRARITVRGKTGPTDVCLVMPGKRGYEHWPYAIERIELTALTLVDWSPEDGITCK